ncbi:uncharacterized protein LOC110604478 [Manihot esculenta]|uniref:Hepatoma-derived growth factor-related protein 2-like n=1 Tax=Manihot esculenta TaxID=3983 RepID=A0A2C9U3Y5_MANES|nr:uncharacterized protein LOC110604478 [Manihot esculenta]XP_043808722.1 uncharacterized protein LOC110604478 [Manihot esculenta]XP_043808723.1 uncharacterized protein LOC110604478 [Manihot esculenta]OAY24311.1 hypothetical protein MANES_17G005300v8 [Manihot esculenta]
MADFGNLSDTDDSAVEELISQAQDLCVLDQLSKINCAAFSESLLPSDLETRFLKLKSKPITSNPNMDFDPNKSDSVGKTSSLKDEVDTFSNAKEKESPRKQIFSPKEENPNGEKSLEEKCKDESLFSPSDSSYSWIENFISTPSKHNSGKRMSSFKTPLGSSNSSRDSPSPPRKSGCFWCSPKKDSKKKKKENWNIIDWGSNNDEFLSDLNIFSSKEQEKILRKAMKEEEKISREAEKIVKWAKQASNRMSFHGIEDEGSDDDDDKSKI